MSTRLGPLFAAQEPRRCDYAPCANGCVILGGCPTPVLSRARVEDPLTGEVVEPKAITREITRGIINKPVKEPTQ